MIRTECLRHKLNRGFVLTVICLAQSALFGGPIVSTVASSVDFSSNVTVNGYVSILGSGFSSDGPHTANSATLPTKLGATQVLLCDASKPSSCETEQLLYVSDSQINFLSGNPTYSAALVKVVVDPSQTSNATPVTLLKYLPGIFVEGSDCLIDSRFTNRDPSCGLAPLAVNSSMRRATRGALTDLQGRLITSANPAHSGDYVTAWAGGLGVFTGDGPPTAVSVRLDGSPVYFQSENYFRTDVKPIFVGESSSFPGLYQINFQIPQGILPFPCGEYNWEFQLTLGEGSTAMAAAVDLPVTTSSSSACLQSPIVAPPYSQPVTITRGGPGAPSSLSGGRLVPMTDPSFRYSRATMAIAGPGYPRNLYYWADPADLNSTFGTLPYTVDFSFSGSDFEIFELGTGGSFRITVDGARVTPDMQSGPPSNGSLYWERVSFASAAKRYISIEAQSAFLFGGINYMPDEQLSPSTIPLGKRSIFAGDSYTEPGDGYVNTTSRFLNWEGWSSGSGGTEYLNPGPTATPPRVKLGDRIATDICPFNPAVVVVAMGINDSSYLASPPFSYSNAQITSAIGAEAARDFSAIRACLPDAQIIAVGPWSPSTPVDASVNAVDLGVQAAACELGIPFISPVQESWITGNQSVPGSGNATAFIGPDGTHPTQAGHDYLGLRLATRILQLAPNLLFQTKN